MKKLGINTISNIAARLWSMISIVIFVPAYIAVLGEEAYGIVSFFVTLQTSLNILGLGLAYTLRREFAVGDDSDETLNKKYKLLKSVEIIYSVIAIVIMLICFIFADYIANEWLIIDTLDLKVVSQVLTLMGISIGVQLVANLYVGCLFGLSHQLISNVYTILWSLLKSLGALIIIVYIKPSLILFYSYHIIIDVIYLIVLRVTLAAKLDWKNREKWTPKDFNNISLIWHFALGIMAISIIALINRQLDVIIISNNLSVTDLGAYNVAITLGSVTAVIPSSFSMAIFPKFTNKATSNDKDIERLFIKTNRYVSVILSALSAFLSVFALQLILLWTKSEIYTGILGSTAFFVVLALAVIEYQEIPYILALAFGNTKLNVWVGSLFIPLVAISTYMAIIKYGLLGAGVVYLVMMSLETLIYLFLVYKTHTSVNPLSTLITHLILPLGLSLCLAYISSLIIKRLNVNNTATCALAVLFGFISLIIVLMVFCKKDIIEDYNSIKKARNL